MQAHIVVLTGAGVSADSGVPTFRDNGGLWEGERVEDVATPEAWARDKNLVWRFYQKRRTALGGVEPNPAHVALAEFESGASAAGAGFTLITQNVDDLHERAGSKALIHMHGELSVLACESCGHKVRDREHVDPSVFVPCPRCAFPQLRPDVVWFGEMPYGMDEIELALGSCTHFLALGTSGLVWPAASFLEAVRKRGAATWVAALERPANTHPGDRWIEGRAAETVPPVLALLAAELGFA